MLLLKLDLELQVLHEVDTCKLTCPCVVLLTGLKGGEYHGKIVGVFLIPADTIFGVYIFPGGILQV
ncbi:MAG: hypothetical protein GX434_09405 [Peptococcaceae bacterium]|nr:hypothetical protein [Peptococcaceae bacterium]